MVFWEAAKQFLGGYQCFLGVCYVVARVFMRFAVDGYFGRKNTYNSVERDLSTQNEIHKKNVLVLGARCHYLLRL